MTPRPAPRTVRTKLYLLVSDMVSIEAITRVSMRYQAWYLGIREGNHKSWQREMDRQGFDPLAKTVTAVVEFMEHIEMSEDFDGERKVAVVTKKLKVTTKRKPITREMDRQGLDPLASTPADVVAFIERIEMSEDFDGNKKTTKVAPGKGKKKSGFAKGNLDADGSKHCMLHGNNNTHNTSECKRLMA